jgi:hypothetical protein
VEEELEEEAPVGGEGVEECAYPPHVRVAASRAERKGATCSTFRKAL